MSTCLSLSRRSVALDAAADEGFAIGEQVEVAPGGLVPEELGLSDRAKNLPGQLSGGQRQRVAIGRALMNGPDLVLFDEPTSALDSTLGEQVMELIRDEMKRRGTAAIVVTHDERITRHTDRTVHITDGRLESN